MVCPSSMRLVWEDQLADWLPPDLADLAQIIVIRTGKDIEKKLGQNARHKRIVIVSYDLAKACCLDPRAQYVSDCCCSSYQRWHLVSKMSDGLLDERPPMTTQLHIWPMFCKMGNQLFHAFIGRTNTTTSKDRPQASNLGVAHAVLLEASMYSTICTCLELIGDLCRSWRTS